MPQLTANVPARMQIEWLYLRAYQAGVGPANRDLPE
jgi:hypothetical protein